MVTTSKELDGLIDDQYVPSSVERKKAVLMYFFIGIVASLSQDEVSVYEMFHLKQSMGRRTITFIFLVFSIIFWFIPWVWVLPLVLFLSFLVVWVVFTKQAREGRYVVNDNKILLPLFYGVGDRVVTIFDLDVEEEDE